MHKYMSVWIYRISPDDRGQDLVEYALLAGFLSISAAATLPSLAAGIGTIFSQVVSLLAPDGATGFGS
jgi:Flp pilus assembly pilin Flp